MLDRATSNASVTSLERLAFCKAGNSSAMGTQGGESFPSSALSNLAVSSLTASSPRWRTSSTMGPTCFSGREDKEKEKEERGREGEKKSVVSGCIRAAVRRFDFALFEMQRRSTQATSKLVALYACDATRKRGSNGKQQRKSNSHRRQDRIKVDAWPRCECQEVLRGHRGGVVGLQRRSGSRGRRCGGGHGDKGWRRSAPARGGGAKRGRRCGDGGRAAAERGNRRRRWRRSRGRRCAVAVARDGCCCRATHAV